jgi:hypothetical protein
VIADAGKSILSFRSSFAAAVGFRRIAASVTLSIAGDKRLATPDLSCFLHHRLQR